VNFVRQTSLQGRSFFNRDWWLHHNEVHGGWDHRRIRAPGGKTERGVVPTMNRVRMQSSNPAPLVQEVFRRVQLPDMRRDTTKLDIDELR